VCVCVDTPVIGVVAVPAVMVPVAGVEELCVCECESSQPDVECNAPVAGVIVTL